MNDIVINNYNILENEEIKIYIDEKRINECLFETVGYPTMGCKYYVDNISILNNDEFPYMVIDGKLNWNVPFKDVSIKNFLETFPFCYENGIEVETGYPMAGGPERIFGKAALLLVITFIKEKYPEYGLSLDVAGIIITAISGFKLYFEEKQITPLQPIEVIINEGVTGSLMIQELINVNEYQAIVLLKALGFHLDKKTGKYKIDDTDKLRAKRIVKDGFDYIYDYSRDDR